MAAAADPLATATPPFSADALELSAPVRRPCSDSASFSVRFVGPPPTAPKVKKPGKKARGGGAPTTLRREEWKLLAEVKGLRLPRLEDIQDFQ